MSGKEEITRKGKEERGRLMLESYTFGGLSLHGHVGAGLELGSLGPVVWVVRA